MKLWFIGILVILVSPLIGQSPQFYAQTDSKRILEDSYLSVSFVLDNAKGSNFRPPAFKDFSISRGPSTSTNMQIVNGKVSQSMTYSYELVPNKTGNLFIEPAAVVAEGKTYRTKQLQVEVVKKAVRKGQATTEPVYVRVEASDSIAYVGQQIMLEYKLFTKLDIRGTSYVDKPEYNGFFAEDVKMSRSSVRREIINGEEYYVKVLDRVALFPQQTGNYTLPGIRFNLRAAVGKPTGFFGTTRTKNMSAKSNSLNILVKDFNLTPPQSFSGGVGSYTMNVITDRTTISADDAFTLRMNISGDGDSRTVNAPVFDVGENLDLYDPNILSDDLRSNGYKIINNKVFEYIIVPKEKGRYRITPEFSYFDVDSSKFITLRSTPLNLTVAPSKGNNSIRRDEKISRVEMAGISDDLSIYEKSAPFYNSSYYWGLFGLAGLASMGILFLKRRQIREDGIDPLLKKSKLAASVASSRLSKADKLIEEGAIKEGFAEISNSLKEYLSGKWNVAYSELNPTVIQDLLSSKGFGEDLITKTKESLSICEMALYAGASAGSIHQVRQQIGELIETIEGRSV